MLQSVRGGNSCVLTTAAEWLLLLLLLLLLFVSRPKGPSGGLPTGLLLAALAAPLQLLPTAARHLLPAAAVSALSSLAASS
jgi:hypothetical protein